MPEPPVLQATRVVGPFHRPVTLIALAMIVVAPAARSAAAEYTIDPDRTSIEFQLRSVGSLQRGHLTGAEGTVALDAAAGTGRIDIVIDTRSVASDNAGIEGVLRGPAMLDVQKYRQIAYRAERIIFVDETPVRIDGELTLRDVTRSVPLVVSRHTCTKTTPQRCSLIANATILRSDFGMSRFKLLANDEVNLSIRAEAIRISPDRSARDAHVGDAAPKLNAW
jgi:polyisoprenoid-binding protein YceI